MRIDARGLGCPKPVILAEEALSKINEGVVEIFVDSEGSVKNLTRFAKNNAIYSETEKADNYWKIKLVKGYPCETAAGPAEKPVEKGLMLVIGTDTLGKDEALGKALMKGFFDTIRVTGELPNTIFFLNAGVRLTTLDEEVMPVLKELQSRGVEIFSCGTCLKHYGLEESLKVGYRGTTNHIVEGMKDFEKVIWI